MDSKEVVKNVLAHHGVKGMRWGQRSTPTRTVTVAKKGKKLKSTGGQGLPAHSDAVAAKKISQIKKKSGVSSLSNEELQAYQKRLNLEQNVSNLEKNQPGVKNWVKRFGSKQGNQHASNVGQVAATKLGKAALAAA